MNDYLYGQRVIYNGDEIATVIRPPHDNFGFKPKSIWIHRPCEGRNSFVSMNNVKPLPNGQL